MPKVGHVHRSWWSDWTRRPTGPPPEKGLNLVLELLSQATQGAITVDLSSEPQKGFALGDSVDFEGVAWHTDSHKGPELDPLVPFGPNGSFEGVVVGRLNGSGRRLNIRARGAHTGGQRSGMPRLDEHGGRKTSDAWEADGSTLNSGVCGVSEVKRG